jgi:hypothetical protein
MAAELRWMSCALLVSLGSAAASAKLSFTIWWQMTVRFDDEQTNSGTYNQSVNS